MTIKKFLTLFTVKSTTKKSLLCEEKLYNHLLKSVSKVLRRYPNLSYQSELIWTKLKYFKSCDFSSNSKEILWSD